MYVDDILAILCYPGAILRDVQTTFKLKNDKVEPKEFYVGAKLQEKPINGIKQTITSQNYVKASVKNVKETPKNALQSLPSRNIETPMSMTYVPELDAAEELSKQDVTFYQELIRAHDGLRRLEELTYYWKCHYCHNTRPIQGRVILSSYHISLDICKNIQS